MPSVAGLSQASSPPDDEELAALYNQVLIGFAEESPTSEQASQKLPSPQERDVEIPYSRYPNNGGDTPRSTQPMSTRSPNPISPGLPSSPRSLPKPSSPTQGRLRPLPPLPGRNSGPAPQTPPPPTITTAMSSSAVMPEPTPYYHDQKPKQAGMDSP
ncbi:hypothetical protein C8Q75DRAFT_625849 [Abortiporus biennis]|nr:hypothetical protein C8Q75DRAFT_625849 [Abortiporus biennis]